MSIRVNCTRRIKVYYNTKLISFEKQNVAQMERNITSLSKYSSNTKK